MYVCMYVYVYIYIYIYIYISRPWRNLESVGRPWRYIVDSSNDRVVRLGPEPVIIIIIMMITNHILYKYTNKYII